jgi:flagellar motility protein MotE (MotC chaperone)
MIRAAIDPRAPLRLGPRAFWRWPCLHRRHGAAGAAATMEEEIRAFCGNIADAARDQRYLLQKKELEELQAGVDERIQQLDERSLQYRDWLKKREEFMRSPNPSLSISTRTCGPMPPLNNSKSSRPKSLPRSS